MPATPAIALEGLTKRFGPDRGVFDVGFEVPQGAIFGFLGPNGAGKTTLIRLMLDYLRPEAGRATILGLDAQRDAVAIRRKLGYVPAELKLDEDGSALALLKYLAGYREAGALERARHLAQRLEIDPSLKIKTMSKGMKQKVALIQAMMHDPELLILDEPTEGLDPLMQHALHELLREAAGRGRTVFFSSHQLGEVELLCDQVAIIGKGKLLAHEAVATLRATRRRNLRVVLREPVPVELPGATLVRQEGCVAELHYVGEAGALLPALAALPVLDFTLEPAPLEETFLGYYQ
jgi:ABC-2 type transport system ATP-binding protein